MTRPLRLKAANEWLNLADLKSPYVPASLNDQEKSAIQFCRQWLNGQQKFEFQTSGSTGIPKKISFKREQLEVSARLTEKALHLQPGYSALICLDVNFIAGAMMMVRSLVTGMDMIIKSPSGNPLNGISDNIDFVALVPYQLVTVLDQFPSALSKLKTVIVGGAPLKEAAIERLRDLSPAFYATYGMTETITHVALQKLNGQDRQNFFQLLPGIHAATDDRSCLIITASYLGRKAIITNDIIELLDERRFRWIGRYDQVINSGGIKVSAEKVEKVVDSGLRELKIQRRFFITGLPNSKLGEQVALILEGDPLSHDHEHGIKTVLTRELDTYEIPKIFLYVSAFLETSTQKIDQAGTIKLVRR